MFRYLLPFAALLWLASPAFAQLNPLGNMGVSDQPLELESDKGLELHQDRQMIVARGNVIVRQADVKLRADIVSASYREIDGRRTVHRVDALGNVVITTGKERLTGEHATYDLERELFLMQGRNLRIEAEQQTVTAEDRLEYWGREKRAIARGEATAIQNSDNTRLRADVIQAQLAPRDGAVPAAENAQGAEALALNLVQAWGHVVIKTENEIVEGDKGTYDAIERIATLEGNVVITRGKNQLRGAKAVVNLETGVSRLVAAPGERVRSVFYPGSADGNGGTNAVTPSNVNPAPVNPGAAIPGAAGQAQPKPQARSAAPAVAGDAAQSDKVLSKGTPDSQAPEAAVQSQGATVLPRPRPNYRR